MLGRRHHDLLVWQGGHEVGKGHIRADLGLSRRRTFRAEQPDAPRHGLHPQHRGRCRARQQKGISALPDHFARLAERTRRNSRLPRPSDFPVNTHSPPAIFNKPSGSSVDDQRNSRRARPLTLTPHPSPEALPKNGILPHQERHPFMRHALVFNIISLITFALAVLFPAHPGLNLSVEFTGGTLMEVNYAGRRSSSRSARPCRTRAIRTPRCRTSAARDILIRLPNREGLDTARSARRSSVHWPAPRPPRRNYVASSSSARRWARSSPPTAQWRCCW